MRVMIGKFIDIELAEDIKTLRRPDFARKMASACNTNEVSRPNNRI